VCEISHDLARDLQALLHWRRGRDIRRVRPLSRRFETQRVEMEWSALPTDFASVWLKGWGGFELQDG
jgi:hypothetical protein